MESFKDPYGVLAGVVLEKAVCQKCWHEVAYDLNKFSDGIFDESGIYSVSTKHSQTCFL